MKIKEIKLINCESGDWDVLIIDGKIFDEAHSIQDDVWLDLLKSKLGVDCKKITISDEDMENRVFEE